MSDECRPGREMDRDIALLLGWHWVHGIDTAGQFYTALIAPTARPAKWEGEGWDETGRVLDWTFPAYSTDKHHALDALDAFCQTHGYSYGIQSDDTGTDEARYCAEIWNPVISRLGATLAEAVCRAMLAVKQESTP